MTDRANDGPAGMPVPDGGARFSLGKRLGSGGTSVVWLAVDRETGATVALKVLSGVRPDSAAFRAMRQEAAIARQLVHPNILPVHTVHADGPGDPFIEMEWAPGGSMAMKAAAHGGSLGWQELKPLALQLCDALAHAHAAGVIHRDIKPANLLLAADGTLKLADFGCAALGEMSRIETSATVTVISQGTLAYMSPQQLNGEKPSPADDVYSAGATLHSLLVGRPPFHTGYLAHQILTARAPSVDAHRKLLGTGDPLPSGVIRAIDAALEKNPARRPGSAGEFRRMLEAGDTGKRSRRRVLVALGAGGLTVCAGAAGLMSSAGRTSRKADPGLSVSTVAYLGQPFEFRLEGWEGIRPLSATGLPKGLALRAAPAAISGIPAEAGIFRIEIAAPGEAPGSAGAVTLSVQPVDLASTGADREVLSAAALPDGGLLVGGPFNQVFGIDRRGLARLTVDGTVDPAFLPGVSGIVRCLLVMPDGSMLVGGDLDRPERGAFSQLARLNKAGSRETSPGIQCDKTVLCLAADARGGVFVGGLFAEIGGFPRQGIARLDAGLRPDPLFDPGADGNVQSIVPLADGAVCVGGRFRTIAGEPRPYLALLGPDGVPEPGFAVEPDAEVSAICLDRDGRLLVGGRFRKVNGQPYSGLFRVSRDGRLDSGFRLPVDGNVLSILPRHDGSVLIAGDFQLAGQERRCGLALVTPDGVLDEGFAADPNGAVTCVSAMSCGGHVIGGPFTTAGDGGASHLALVGSGGDAALEAGRDGRLVWHRPAASGLLQAVVFEFSTDAGATWSTPQAATHAADGWALPWRGAAAGTVTVRASGRVSGGIHNGSSGVVEASLALP